MITLVLGGTRSGKSAMAQRLAEGLAPPVTFVATTTPLDDDMAVRVASHRAARPPGWTTIEGEDLLSVLRSRDGTMVVDSLGTWVASRADFAVDPDLVCAALTARRGDTVVVSDEVGLGVHPSTESGRRFRDALGEVNRRVAEIADDVLLVVAGRVLTLVPAPEAYGERGGRDDPSGLGRPGAGAPGH